MSHLTTRDKERLEGIHEDLRLLVELAAEFAPIPFMVLEGVRSVEAQQANVASGASQTMNSRHLTGHAVDLGPLKPNGQIPGFGTEPADWPYFEAFAAHMKGAAALCGTKIVWGGDWTTLKDGPHFELEWHAYPIEPEPAVPAEEPIAI